MSRHERHFPISVNQPVYTVLGFDDPKTRQSRAQAERLAEELYYDRRLFQVWECELWVGGTNRDVTEDFIPTSEPDWDDYPDPAASRADALYQARREGVL